MINITKQIIMKKTSYFLFTSLSSKIKVFKNFSALVLLLLLYRVGSIAAQSTLIYTQDFSASAPTGWTVVNAGLGNNWVTTSNSGANSYNGNYSMTYSYNSTYAANTWAFTQGVAMTAGKTYRVEFYQRVHSASFPEK